ncbi:basic leucine zipper transcriptional factor ATF-like 3 isoform X1 [Neopsephotus bourkii]|uniref:basic leucine zipper transcriptional factor ATF-like 3 isoform X1 n=1 Tax=Neopsephotus bourkii TaxID=309878 RepID=UPI002AA560F4|nr:basic leucine zipper transcriptional factor ATF-like 3 isoform X1 [Neopsephotus bourkii]
MVRIPVPLEQKGRVWSDEGNVVVAQRGFGLQQRRLPQPWPGFAFTRSSLEFPDGLKEPGRAAKVKIARSQRRSRARPGCPCTELAPLRGPMAERCGPGRRESHEEDDRKVRRREKNRVAAQRSRKKQTQKADKLHEEYESLEQENTSLRREIGKLTDEMKHLSEVLKDHEKVCPLLHCTMNFVTIPRPDALTGCLPR